jgi:hypothetical protein
MIGPVGVSMEGVLRWELTTYTPLLVDDYFLATSTQGDDQQILTCQACDASSLVTNLIVPAAIGTTVVAVAASCILPTTRQRWLALGQWLYLQEETLIALNGKLGVLFLLDGPNGRSAPTRITKYHTAIVLTPATIDPIDNRFHSLPRTTPTPTVQRPFRRSSML